MAGSNSDEPNLISRLSNNSMNLDGAGRAVQFHPEFKSKPTGPHPLFNGFIAATVERRKIRGDNEPKPEAWESLLD